MNVHSSTNEGSVLPTSPFRAGGTGGRLMVALLGSLMAGVAMTGALVTEADAAAGANVLTANEQLAPGERLVSPDGRYVLVMQDDGNLVEYASGNRPVWASGTNAAHSVVRMQGDGNVVIVAPGNRPVWATGTNGNPGAALELQSDANLVVYGQGRVARWASGTAQAGSTLADRIVGVAGTELRTSSRNFETGTNCNYYAGALGSGTPCGNGWRAEAWCADFSRWVWGQAGASTADLSAGAASFVTYGRRHNTWRATAAAGDARVGDAVVFHYDGVGYASHVGLVVAVDPGRGTITTIEGNSSDRVRQLTFVPRSRGVSGFTSPVR